jgi:hypothetical protein
MEFLRAVWVSGLVVAVMATGCTASSPATRSAEVYMVYQDLAGWSAEIPPGWKVLPFETSKGNASAVGTQISNVELPAPEIDPGLPIQTSGLVLPPDGVSLIIATDNDPENVRSLLNPHRRRRSPWRTSPREVPQAEGRRSRSCGSR